MEEYNHTAFETSRLNREMGFHKNWNIFQPENIHQKLDRLKDYCEKWGPLDFVAIGLLGSSWWSKFSSKKPI